MIRSFSKFLILFSLIFTFSIFINASDAMAEDPSCGGTGNNANGDPCSEQTSEDTCTGGCYWSEEVKSDTDSNALVDVICNALRIVTGNAGKAFAAFAIISLGIGFFTGKVSWGLMIGVAAGIAAMFGAPTIVAAISGDDAFDCTA